MVREDLVKSAVAFLQDPSVASASVDQRISFLQSKNLTQEEINLSLARAGDETAIPKALPANVPSYGYLNQQATGQQPGYDYGRYPGGGFWAEPPRRDWRDWFIMATVSSGVSYGLYIFAKRYILPLISPPTPSQLASDKAAVDESFSRAFALIDQLASDTANLKLAETERTEKLDVTLGDVESVIADLKAANSRREIESRILSDQVLGLKDLVPKALDGWKAAEDKKLEDLGAELRSLKLLVANRLSLGAASQASSSRSYPSSAAKDRPDIGGTSGSASVANAGEDSQGSTASAIPESGVTAPKQESIGRYQSGGKVSIPLWQMPATAGKGKGVSDTSKNEEGNGIDAEE